MHTGGALSAVRPEPVHLTDEERATFQQCAERCQRLEQEKIPQPQVDEQIARLAAVRRPWS